MIAVRRLIDDGAALASEGLLASTATEGVSTSEPGRSISDPLSNRGVHEPVDPQHQLPASGSPCRHR